MSFEVIKRNLKLENVVRIRPRHWTWTTGFAQLLWRDIDEIDAATIALNEASAKKIMKVLDKNKSKFVKSYIIMLIGHSEKFERERNTSISSRKQLKNDILEVVSGGGSKENEDETSEDLESWKWMTDFLELMSTDSGSDSESDSEADVVTFTEESTKKVFDMLEGNDSKNMAIKKFIVMLIDNCEKFEKERNEQDARREEMKRKVKEALSLVQ
jgi:hypothetical protein